MLHHERLTILASMPRWVRWEHQARYAFAARHVRDQRVVDCACGEGDGASAFLAAGARSVEAFDVSADAVARAAVRCAAPNFRGRVADGIRLPLARGTVDVYVALETIEHVASAEAFLDEVVRVLRPSGCFICSTPNRAVTNPNRPPGHRLRNPFHVREYTEEEFRERLQARFEVVELYGQNPVSRVRGWVMEQGGRLLPFYGPLVVHQLSKFPWLFWDRPAVHVVRPLEMGRRYGYLVAICRRPRASSTPDS